jgi:beta-lactamase class A
VPSPAFQEEIARVPATVGVAVEDLSTGQAWWLAPDERFPAASIIKVPILMEVLRQGQEGRLDLQETVTLRSQDKVGGAGILFELGDGVVLTLRDLCRLMIVISDNTASNLLLERVGFEAVRALMARLGMARSELNRYFMQPARHGENWTTPRDVAACLRALWQGQVLTGPWRQEALDILRRQQFREKIPLMLPTDLVVAHKTGELDEGRVRHDAGIVELPGRPYLLVLLSKDGGPPWEVDLGLARASRRLYEHFAAGVPEGAAKGPGSSVP